MQPIQKYRILIVDDEPDIAMTLKMGLEKHGFEVEAITDPIKALEYYELDKEFDLALLDVKMLPINGFELYRRMLELNGKLRVCFITAFEIYYDEFKRVFPKIKVECFVRKPVSIDTLAATIKAEIERKLELELPGLEEPR